RDEQLAARLEGLVAFLEKPPGRGLALPMANVAQDDGVVSLTLERQNVEVALAELELFLQAEALRLALGHFQDFLHVDADNRGAGVGQGEGDGPRRGAAAHVEDFLVFERLADAQFFAERDAGSVRGRKNPPDQFLEESSLLLR